MASDRSSYEIPPGRVSALLPPVFFACGVSSFAAALIAFPFLVPLLGEHFYQPPVLAVTHLVTLGWVSAIIMGVLYRYVPGLTKQPLPYPRLAIVQWAAFVAGTAGRGAVPIASLGVPRWAQAPIFGLVNAGLGATVAGLCAGWPTAAFAGSIGVTAGGLTYVAVVARTLAFALVDPARSRSPLPVLP